MRHQNQNERTLHEIREVIAMAPTRIGLLRLLTPLAPALGLVVGLAGADQRRTATPTAIPLVEPGGTDLDASMAINNPHEYAWRLFLFMNRQAAGSAPGVADPAKTDLKAYDPDKPVVWETWAVATGGLFLSDPKQNTSEVYRYQGQAPVPWDQLPRGTAQPAKRLEPTLTTFVDTLLRSGSMTGQPRPGQISIFALDLANGDDEIRMNRSTYETIRANNLYSAEGLNAKLEEARQTGNVNVIKFDRTSKEIKATWVPITEAQKERYHWRMTPVLQPDGSTKSEVLGLAGLHIITKDLPNWFWTDFSHIDQELQATTNGRPFVDPTTRGPNAPHGANGVRQETVGSKWQYYRLSGIQVDFTDSKGKHTTLANEIIEPIASGPSSCITCHAKATVGGITSKLKPPLIVKALSPNFVDGLPDPSAYVNAQGGLQFIQTDFLWSPPFRAHSVKEK